MFRSRALLHGFSSFQTRLGHTTRSSQSSSAQTALKVRGGNTLIKAAITSGAFSLLGDLLAQAVSQRGKANSSWHALDLWRLARMAGFGFVFYGPYQFKWYGLLDRQFPTGPLKHFVSKVALNQLALSPVVLTFAFSWNLILTQHANEIPAKLKRDLLPTMVNGWIFWVPASSLNFAVIPLQYQVLYMSACSVLWTAYISHASNAKVQKNVLSAAN